MATTLVAGTLVRHAKQPGWGVGAVVSAAFAGGVHDLVITFDVGGQRRLKLADTSLLVPLTDDELLARDAAEAAAQQAEVAERAARQKRMKATTRKPFARLPCAGAVCVEVGDGTVAFNGKQGLAFADARGQIVDELQRPERYAEARDLSVAADGSLAGWCSLDDAIVLARRGEGTFKLWRHGARMWHPDVEAVAGVGAVVTSSDGVFIVRAEGPTAERVDLRLRGTISSHTMRWWNGDLVCGTYDLAAPDGDQWWFHAFTRGGAVRFEGRGMHPLPIDDERLLVCDPDRLRVFDRQGVVRKELRIHANAPSIALPELSPFARVDGDLVVSTWDHDGRRGLLRFDPTSTSPAPRWHAPLPADLTALSHHPVRVGPLLAIACRTFEGEERSVIVVVRASDGAPVARIDVRDEINRLVPAGDDALGAMVNAKRSHAWSGLSSGSPRPHLLAHGHYCHAMCSPAPNVLACLAGDDVCFYPLDDG